MRRGLAVLLFLVRRRARNWWKRTVATPARFLPMLLVMPAALIFVLAAVAILFLPAFDETWEIRPLAMFRDHEAEMRSAIFGVLVLVTFGVISKALEGDLLAFHQSDVDFLFPAPVSRQALVIVRLVSDWIGGASVVLPLTLYLLLPLRISIPSRATALWAVEVAVAVLALVVLLTNLGRIAQAVFAARVEGLRAARVVRGLALAWVLALLGALIVDRLHGEAPLATPVSILTSGAARAVFAPCAWIADLYVAPLAEPIPPATPVLWLLAGAVLSGIAVIAVARSACESAISATARRHALWQAIRKSDASSVRAAELMGRQVHGWSRGLPRFGSGAGALVSRAVVYGWRNSPWGVVVAALLAVSPLAFGGVATQVLESSDLIAHDGARYIPLLALCLIFAWSQRMRLAAREEFSRLIYLRSLPIRPGSIVASMLVIPTVTFSLFLAALLASSAFSFPEVEPSEAGLVAVVTPTLFAALGAVHLCSALLYPVYDPSFGKGFLADLALLPVAGLVFGSIVGVGALAYYGGAGAPIAAVLASGLALVWLAAGIQVAGRLFGRMEPGD